MLYNKLLGNTYRLACYYVDETRCSGRSTAIALRAIAEAVSKPTVWIPLTDHYEEARQVHHVELAKWAMHMVDKLGLLHFERRANEIRSCHMTANQMELA